jgi:AcrR family transcriptional regulator
VERKNLSTRKEKALETKHKIYESAKELFSKYDYETVNVDDIVKHAGVAKGSFYVHFESKDYLIAILINDYVKQVDVDYKTYLDSLPADMPTYEILLALIEKIADVLTQNIGHNNMRLLYRILLEKNIETNVLTDYSRDLYKLFHDIISKGIKQKVFRSSLNIEEVTKHFVAAYRGLAIDWCVRYPNYNLKEQAISHFKLLLNGICG